MCDVKGKKKPKSPKSGSEQNGSSRHDHFEQYGSRAFCEARGWLIRCRKAVAVGCTVLPNGLALMPSSARRQELGFEPC